MEKTTLCYLEQNGCYLMLHRNKRKNDMNANKWLGIGGHFQDGETPDLCIIREVKEETNLSLLDYKKRGIVLFENDDYKEMIYLYTSDFFSGRITGNDEGELSWIRKEDIDDLNIWKGDKVFLDLLRKDAPYFILKLTYSKNVFIRSEMLDDIPEVYQRG